MRLDVIEFPLFISLALPTKFIDLFGYITNTSASPSMELDLMVAGFPCISNFSSLWLRNASEPLIT